MVLQKSVEFEHRSQKVLEQIEVLKSQFTRLVAEVKAVDGKSSVFAPVKVEGASYEDPVQRFGPEVNFSLPALSLAFCLSGPLAAFLTVGT